jgi:UDP:flavonoid glycosyltransferase YjiC (YdhE family)
VPLKADQFENAARVMALGAGQQLSGHATSAQLRRGAMEVLTDSRFRRAAQRLAHALAGKQDADPVAELEALARPRPAPSQPALPALSG